MRRALILVCAAMALALVAMGVSPSLESARTAADLARAEADMRSLATGIESYYVDNMQYPPSGRATTTNYLIRDPERFVSLKYTVGSTVNDRCSTASWSRQLVTFRLRDSGQQFSTITTPIAYVERLPIDPYADDPQATYAYYNSFNSWVTYSPGPLGWPSQPPAAYRLEPELPVHDRLLPLAGNSEMLPGHVSVMSYDPTNGSESRGFVIRRKR
ncbi:MAG: hypothetical protein ACR2IE_05125 [Candidatus Sumerlaeaceae bacterium]